MGWDSAYRKRKLTGVRAGAYVKPPEPEPEPEPREITPDEMRRILQYENALRSLMHADRKFRLNYETFRRWDITTQLWWIGQIEQQARDGKDTIGALVVVKVVEMRLE